VTTDVVDEGFRDRGSLITPREDVYAPPPDQGVGAELDAIIIDGSHELQIQGDIRRFMLYGESIELSVLYLNIEPNHPAPIPVVNRPIRFKILAMDGTDRTGEGIGNAHLVSSQQISNAQGLATVTLRSGERRPNDLEEHNFQIQAEAEGAAPVTWNLTLSDLQEGDLRVIARYDYENNRYRQADLAAAQVYLFINESCMTIRGMLPNSISAYMQLPAIEPFNAFEQETSVAALEAGATFSVLAVAENQDGNVLSWGCEEGITIRGRQTSVEVFMQDLPLLFKGVLQVQHRFDLFGLMDSSDNETLQTISQVLELLRVLGNSDGDRGRALVEIVCELVSIGEGTCSLLQSIAGPLVDRAIDEFLPQNVVDILTIISDVLTIVADLTVNGELEFPESTPDETGSLGEHNDSRWQSFDFVWRNDCQDPQGCRRTIPVGDIDNNARVVAGTFHAQVRGMTLEISPHNMTFKYGLIALGVIEEWLLPAIFDEEPPEEGNGLAWILEHFLPCGDINEALRLDRDDPLCHDVLVLGLSDVIYGQLEGLDFEPDQFEIVGSATVEDQDGDLVVDHLNNGVWDGIIHLENSDLGFRGCFEACRDNPGASDHPEGRSHCEPRTCNIPAFEE